MSGIGIIFAILFLWFYLRKSEDTPAALRESYGTYWQKPNLTRLKTIASKLDSLKIEIEEEVGLDPSSGEAASLEEGALQWEDCVEPGFEKEEKLWWKVKKEYDRIDRQISALEGSRR